MKKYSKKIISFVLVVMMSITMFVPAFANGEISVYLDNEKIQFDVTPILVNGRTMVPMRAIFEKLGAVVFWDNDTRTAIAQKGNVNVSISIDDTTLYKNGEPVVLDVPAQLNSSRTLVPLRAVSEAFECDVQWDGDTQTVRIFSSKTVKEQQKTESIDKLINWVNDNYNHSHPPDGHKVYVYKLENHEIEIVPIVGTIKKSLNINYLVSDNDDTVSVSVWLLNARFGGSYLDKMGKGYNSAEGYIVKSNVSNSLELNCDWYTGTYAGDKNTLLEKYQSSVNIILKLFDSFLKTNDVGLTLEDFGLDFDLSSVVLPKGLTQQEITFEALRALTLAYQESENSNRAELVKTFEDSNGSTQYSILYDDEKDIIRLTNTRIYKGSYTSSSIDLTPDKQSYECSFYFAKNKYSTPDFEATYIIDAKTFGENSNINFENIKGNKTNMNSYKEVTKLMNLDMLEHLDWVFSLADFAEFSTNDFGFNLE